MRNFVSFLNEKDRETLLAKAERKAYTDGTRILEQGTKNSTLFIIHKGDVSIVTRAGSQEMEVAQLHRDDVFGEMSYVDAEPASADIVALGNVEIDFITAPKLKEIIKRDPLFYGRFYRAIARTLSLRLRHDNYKAQSYMNTGR